MNHNIIEILIYTKEKEIQAYLEQQLRSFACHIQTISSDHPTTMSGDIIVWDQTKHNLSLLCSQKRQDAYLFYIMEDDCLEEIIQGVDEVIPKTSSWAYLAKRIQHQCTCFRNREELWLTQTYLDTLIDSMPDLVWFKDNQGSHVKVNQAFCQTVGKKREDIEGKQHCAVWDVDVDDCAITENIVRDKKKTCQFNELVRSMHGMRQFHTYKSPLFNQRGEMIGTVGVGHDITDLENMSTEMEILFNSMPFALLLKDQTGSIVNVNHKFEEYFGCKKEEIIGVDYEEWYQWMFSDRAYIERKGNRKTFIFCDKNDRILEISQERIYDIFKSDVGEVYIYRDSTEEYLMEQQLNTKSNTDFLTGLFNRRYFYQYFSDEHAFEQISILYVDLDYFKKVNDTYGHQIGDEALRISAQTLKALFCNDLIARLGGDEFLIAKTELITEAQLIQAANELIAQLQKNFESNAYFQELSASVGISYTTNPAKLIDDLIKESDTALYEAKQTGRAKCCVYHNEKSA